MVKRICFGLLICMLMLSFTAFAQESTGGIQGTAKDPSGAVVPRATVDVSSPALIGKKSATTDSGGYYHFEQLPPGLYSIAVSASGFGPATQSNLQLATGALPTVNFSLKVGGVTTEVSVSAEANVIEVSQSR